MCPPHPSLMPLQCCLHTRQSPRIQTLFGLIRAGMLIECLLVQLALCSQSLLHGKKWYDRHDYNTLRSNHLIIGGGGHWKIGGGNLALNLTEINILSLCEKKEILVFTFKKKLRLQFVHQVFVYLIVWIIIIKQKSSFDLSDKNSSGASRFAKK